MVPGANPFSTCIDVPRGAGVIHLPILTQVNKDRHTSQVARNCQADRTFISGILLTLAPATLQLRRFPLASGESRRTLQDTAARTNVTPHESNKTGWSDVTSTSNHSLLCSGLKGGFCPKRAPACRSRRVECSPVVINKRARISVLLISSAAAIARSVASGPFLTWVYHAVSESMESCGGTSCDCDCLVQRGGSRFTRCRRKQFRCLELCQPVDWNIKWGCVAQVDAHFATGS